MDSTEDQPQWKPLERNERRVLGVLVEKAKTTPDAYPLTLNALRTGCNQKSNRSPLVHFEEHEVEEALDGLREAGAVTCIQGDGRAEKYRHHAYEWLGVTKVELAVMAELLLRGAQTLGELRTRAARMAPIRSQADLTPVVDALIAKNLVLYLTRPGRGAIVSHNLYQPEELKRLRAEYEGGQGPAPQPAAEPPAVRQPGFREDPPAPDAAAELREEVATLRQELAALREEVEDLKQRALG